MKWWGWIKDEDEDLNQGPSDDGWRDKRRWVCKYGNMTKCIMRLAELSNLVALADFVLIFSSSILVRVLVITIKKVSSNLQKSQLSGRMKREMRGTKSIFYFQCFQGKMFYSKCSCRKEWWWYKMMTKIVEFHSISNY